MSEALGVIDATPAIDTNTSSSSPKGPGKPANSGRSTLGGGNAILKGLQDLMGGNGKAEDKGVAVPAAKELPKGKEPAKTDATPPAKTDAVPDAKTVADKPQSTEPVKGTDGMTAEERAAFVANKKGAEGWQSEKETVTKELTTLKQQLEELKAEKERHELRLKEVEPVALIQDIRLHPKYKDSIEKPAKEINAFLDKVCTKYTLKQDEVMAAIWNKDQFAGNEAIAEMQSTMDSVTGNNFSRAIQDLRKLSEDEAKLMSDPAATMTALNADRDKAKAEQKAKDDKTYSMAREKVWTAMNEKFPFMKEHGIDDEVKKEADGVSWDEMSPDAKAYFAQVGTAWPYIPGILKKQTDEISQLKAALAQATKQVSPANGLPHQEGDKPTAGMKPSDFLRSKGMLFGR